MAPTGNHAILDNDFYCLVCESSGNSLFHGDNPDLIGESFECQRCNNYIVYTENNTITKDEIYFDNGFYLIRNLEEQESYFAIDVDHKVYGGEEVCTFPYILLFDNIKELFAKLKLLALFS